jgi:hypothetical protein
MMIRDRKQKGTEFDSLFGLLGGGQLTTRGARGRDGGHGHLPNRA